MLGARRLIVAEREKEQLLARAERELQEAAEEMAQHAEAERAHEIQVLAGPT